jgi:molybdopterin-guanine dinucleotide biosynthesis protein A
VNAAILAGGTASRLGGVEKGLIRIRGVSAIDRLIRTLHGFKIVIVCRDDEQKKIYSPYSEVITDEFKGMGPLAGIHAALKHFKDTTLVVGIDMPFVKRRVVEILFKEISNAHAIIPVWKDGRTEPLLACYAYKALDRIENNLKKGKRKIMDAMDMSKTILYPIEYLQEYDKELTSFLNINTPEDLKRVEKICSLIDLEE